MLVTQEQHITSSTQSQGSLKRPAPRGTAAYPRKRAVKACQVCRARRTKCDNLKPSCSFCLKVGAVCNQSPTDMSSFDPASLRILERLDDLERLLKDKPTSPSRSFEYIAAASQVIHREGHVHASTDQFIPDTVTSRLLPPTVEEVLAWPEFNVGSGAPPSFMSAFQSRPSEISTDGVPPSQLYELEPQSAKFFLDKFFAHTHVKNPILDEVHTRQLVSKLALHGIDWSPQSCLALLICALGSLAAPVTGKDDTTSGSAQYQVAQSFFQAAQKRLGICVTSGDIISTQCLFLSGVFMITIFRPIEAWRLFLQALSNCQTLGFLSDTTMLSVNELGIGSPETPRTISTTSGGGSTRYGTQAIEHAIYWSAWKSEMEMRFELQPQDFRLPSAEEHSYPEFFPSPPNINDHDASIDGLTLSEQRGWFFYLSEISLRRLSSQIRSEILGFQSWTVERVDILETLAISVEQYELQVKGWYDALPDPVRFDFAPTTDDICKFVLRGHYTNIFEMIYWPFVDAAIHHGIQRRIPSITQGSSVMRSKLMNLAYKGLLKHVERIHNDRCGYKHRHHGTLPMLRSNTRSALVLLAAAFSIPDGDDELGPIRDTSEPPYDWRFQGLHMPSGWQSAVVSVIEVNRYWQDEAADAKWRMGTLERIYSKAQDMGLIERETRYSNVTDEDSDST